MPFVGVVLEKPRTEPAGFDADGVVDGWIVGGVPVEDVEGDAVLLDWIVRAGEEAFDHIAEEELAAVSFGEDARATDAFELGANWSLLQ